MGELEQLWRKKGKGGLHSTHVDGGESGSTNSTIGEIPLREGERGDGRVATRRLSPSYLIIPGQSQEPKGKGA